MDQITEIKKVGIVGNGKMGSGIFNYLLDFPFELVWACSPSADTEKLSRQLGKRIRRSLEAGIIDQARFDVLSRVPVTRDHAALEACDLIIEAVPEEPGLKREIFARLDEIVRPEAIFASNSSSINPSEMAPAGRHAGQFAGLHFFYPVALKNIVEFTVTTDTTASTITAIETFLDSIRRFYIRLNEKNSFMLNRIFLDFQNEAFLIVQSGWCSYSQMDQLVRERIFPFGVFDFCDSVGLDTMLSSIRNYTKAYPHRSHFSGFLEVLSDLVSRGKLGRKSQEGFYTYPPGVMTMEAPDNPDEIVEYLRRTWILSARRFTSLAHLPIEDANRAIREYFDIPKGPFG